MMIRLGIIGWSAVVLLCGVIVTGFFVRGINLETNLLSLLPDQDEPAWVVQAKAKIEKDVTRRAAFLLSHADRLKLQIAVEQFRSEFENNRYVMPIEKPAGGSLFKDPVTLSCVSRILLSTSDRRKLEGNDGQFLAKRALAIVLSPFSILDETALAADPFLLLPAYLNAMPFATRRPDSDGIFRWQQDGMHFAFFMAQLRGNPLAYENVKLFVPQIENRIVQISTEIEGLKVLRTGAVFFAAAGTQSAEREASIIGAISIVGILVLCLLVFRSVRPLGYIFGSISVGILCGTAVSLSIFGSIHLISLVFGAGLIGIAVDYSFHFWAQSFIIDKSTPKIWVRRIAKPLTLGMLSTVLGFLTLTFSQFPGLQQISVFAASGLFMSYLTVVMVFPFSNRPRSLDHQARLLRFLGHADRYCSNISTSIIGKLCLLGLVCLAVFGGFRFQIDDNVRRLQVLDTDLIQQQQDIQNSFGPMVSGQFLLVSGRSLDAVLRAEEVLEPELVKLHQTGVIVGYRAVSHFLPSKIRRAENNKLIENRLIGPYLKSHQTKIGLAQEALPNCVNRDDLTDSLKNAIPGVDTQIVASGPTTWANVVLLQELQQPEILAKFAAEQPHLRFVDYSKDVSSTMAKLRRSAFPPLLVAGLAIWVMLSLFGGTVQALKTMLPPILAVALTPLVTSAFGEVFTLFNLMALILVFAVGLDYSLFLSHAGSERRNVALLANGLSGLSTILAFGLLMFSELYAVHAFGVTLFCGILLSILFSMIPVLRLTVARDPNAGNTIYDK